MRKTLKLSQHRYYNPATMRWLQPDPIGFAGGDANVYAYVGNDPVNYIDPIGLYRFAPDGRAYAEPVGFVGAGYNMTALLGAEASGGYFRGTDFAGDTISGGFSSEGFGGGISAGGDAFVGFTTDRNINTVNLNLSYGIGSLSIFFNPLTKLPIGGTLGPGFGFGASITNTQTKFHQCGGK